MTEAKKTYYERNKEKFKREQQEKIQKKYEGKTEGLDFIVCLICGYKGADLGTHLKTHGINSKEYKNQFGNDAPIKCDKIIKGVSGKNNPGYQHGGKFSPFSDNFLYAKDGYKESICKRAADSRRDNDNETTKISYWLKKTDGDIIEAKRLLSERQSTFSLDICIERYGEEKGKQRWFDRQERWIRTLSSKSLDELEDINRRKSNNMSWKRLWKNVTLKDGIFYILDLGCGLFKIGITTQDITKRYKSTDIYKIIKQYQHPINICFMVEQLIKKYNKPYSIQKKDKIGDFGWTETFMFPDTDIILSDIESLFNDTEETLKLFKSEFNLKYEDNFI